MMHCRRGVSDEERGHCDGAQSNELADFLLEQTSRRFDQSSAAVGASAFHAPQLF
jgi:hypothetical protein